jgi:hypothetical protein
MDGWDMDRDFLPPHSDLGASAMERWSHCPASFGLSQRERHRMPTIHAATGTIAHELVEEVLKAALQGDDPLTHLQAVEGKTFTTDGHAVTVDTTMMDGVMMMIGYLSQRSRELGVKPLVEQTVFVDGYFPPGEPPPVRMFGRADTQFRTRELLEIVDYKNGGGVWVKVADNPQLLFYAAGALAALAAAGETEPPRVRLTVVQPNIRSTEKIRSYDLTGLDVVMWVHENMIPAVRACESPTAPYAKGDWCRFCPVAHACPELLKDAQIAARLQFDDSAEADVIADRLSIAENAVLWADAMRGFALERIKDGLRVPGWGAAPTRPRRQWTDEHSVGRILAANGIEPWETKLSSPAQIEKRAGKNSSAWRLVEPYVESKSSGVRLSRTGNDDSDLFEMIEP